MKQADKNEEITMTVEFFEEFVQKNFGIKLNGLTLWRMVEDIKENGVPEFELPDMDRDFPILIENSICNDCADRNDCLLSKANRYERDEFPDVGDGEYMLMVDPPEIKKGRVISCPRHCDGDIDE